MKKLIKTWILISVLGMKTAFTQPETTKVQEVIVVFKTHFDIGYTDWAANVTHNYAGSMVEGALDIIEQSKKMPQGQQFQWIVAGWPMKVMLANSKPEVRTRIQEAIQDGSFIVHSLPFTFETEACDLEPMVQSLGYSAKINREAGLALPIDAKQTDVPSHSWVLPTVLVNAGVKFLHIGCNPASRSPEVPLLFWWEGPDGSQLMTMYFGPYYGTSPAPPENWPFKTWLAIIHTNDNTGAPTFEEYRKAIREIEEKNPGAKVRSGSMADFYKAIEAENPQLPVIRGDMPDTWIHGYMSMPREVKMARKLSVDIFNLQKLNTLSGIWGDNTDEQISEKANNALEEIHLFNEHTFGLAMSHGHSGYWAYSNEFETQRALGWYDPIEFSWQEKSQRVIEANQCIAPLLSQKMKALAASVNIEGDRILIYNPLPWERSGQATLHTNNNLKKALKNIVTGEIIEFSKDHNVYRFAVDKVPPMGYTTLVPVDEEVKASGDLMKMDRLKASFENKYLKVVLDTTCGTISSMIDKRSGKEMVAQQSEWKFGQYVYERFSKDMTDQYAKDYIKAGWDWAYAELGRINLTDEPYRRLSGQHPKIEFSRDENSVSARVHFNSGQHFGHKYSVIFTLYNNRPYLEVIWSINGKPADAWPEAGWISFPVNVENPRFRLGRPGAIVDPVTEFITGSNLDYGFLNSGMAMIDGDQKGVGLMSPDVPGISLDRPGLWKYSTDFVPKKANVFFNLYNNQWSTNFTEWIEGSWSTRFYIWSVDHYSNEASIITPSEEIRNPLMVEMVHGPAGETPVTAHGVSLSEKGVLVTYFGENINGEGNLIRLWEQSGKETRCKVTLPQGHSYKMAFPCNLRGEKTGNSISLNKDSFEVRLKGNQPASFILEK